MASPSPCPSIGIRTGDTPPQERARFLRDPADILITTPESLFLMLTSNARERLASVDTVIIDEIHALVPGKRGAHLALSLERLEALRAADATKRAAAAWRRLRRCSASACRRRSGRSTRWRAFSAAPRRGRRSAARSAKKRAHGAAAPLTPCRSRRSRPSCTTSSPTTRRRRPSGRSPSSTPSDKKQLALRIEVPVEDMAQLAAPIELPSGPAAQGPVRASIWSSIHPRLLELIRAHHSTLLFVNSRRLAERLAGALNELAGEPLVRSHHGSLARAARSEVEDLLKAGRIPALVATSSLELGIDMGAIDLVIQIEAPPSVASGLQRIGRAGHQVGAVSEGIIFPKFRGDLVACAAVARAMHDGQVEVDALSAQSARRAGAADRGDGRAWTAGTSTTCSPRSAAPRRSPT